MREEAGNTGDNGQPEEGFPAHGQVKQCFYRPNVTCLPADDDPDAVRSTQARLPCIDPAAYLLRPVLSRDQGSASMPVLLLRATAPRATGGVILGVQSAHRVRRSPAIR
jgi:hypothetical protein